MKDDKWNFITWSRDPLKAYERVLSQGKMNTEPWYFRGEVIKKEENVIHVRF